MRPGDKVSKAGTRVAAARSGRLHLAARGAARLARADLARVWKPAIGPSACWLEDALTEIADAWTSLPT